MNSEHTDDTHDDDVEALLRQVGGRDEPSAAMMEEVRQAVHGEWRAVVAQRKRQRRTVIYAMAASIALIVIVASWALLFVAPAPGFELAVARIEGQALLAASSGQPTHALRVGDSIGVDAVLSTSDSGRVALEYGAGASVRIDRNSTIERVAPDRFLLSAGAVYIDAHPQIAEEAPLVIETSAGEVRHLGTQYQVRQSPEALVVSIREGRVEIMRGNDAALASAGERVRITEDGGIQRSVISAQDPAWDWAEATAPMFEIHDRTLAEFLEWAARETGRRVAYASRNAQRAAEELKLRGSIEGLDPETALSAVLSTTDFTRYESGRGLIGVRLEASDDSGVETLEDR